VRYCIGDGGGTDSAANARNLPYLAAQAMGFGLTREQALRAITLSAAEVLGVADRLGSIDVGKSADLFVADGDPLEFSTRIEAVYIAGKAVSLETRQTRLFDKYDKRPRGPKARPRAARR
jgi:imidazolonepropionase-like amidohydrolase